MCGFLTVGSKELEIDVFDEALGKIEGRGPDMVETSRLFDKTFWEIENDITWVDC